MLKSLNISELEGLAAELDRWNGAQLQSVSGNDRELSLGLYHHGVVHTVWVEMDPRNPLVLLFDNFTPKHRKAFKPIHLFLKSNFIGKRLEKANVTPERGRVLFLEFSEAQSLELRLFPHGQNIIASTGEKTLSWAKVKELASVEDYKAPKVIRTVSELRDQWFDRNKSGGAPKTGDQASFLKTLKKDLAKKKRGLEKLQETIQSDPPEFWQELGQWLQSFGNEDFPGNVPEKFSAKVDLDESLSWNIQNAFGRYEKSRKKLSGRSEQVEKLICEIDELEQKLLSPDKIAPPKEKPKKNLLVQAGATGRKKVLSSAFEAFIGKSARENIAILRRAKAWDFWLHIKDIPGAHAIICRNKRQDVADSIFIEASKWLISESLGQKSKNREGEVFEILVAECRFVRPIKGDKVGRVNYSNERVLKVRF